MQHDRIRHVGQPATSENVGDVLASIRRLIAQDQARLPCGRNFSESPCPSAKTDQECHDAAYPLVLGHDDLVAPDAKPGTPAKDGPRLHLASVSEAAVQAGPALAASSNWQPSLIADWPGLQAQPTPAPRSESPWTAPRPVMAAPAVQLVSPPTDLSPEDEAELAEAEASLAKMIMGPRSTGAPLETAAEHPHTTGPAIKDVTMAQDMRMMEMGRIEEVSAMRALPGAEDMAAFAAARAASAAQPEPEAPNLFGEMGAVAKDATMRMLIRDAIQQELHGELGARLSRNMCQMIRQEVESVIREICAES